MVVRSLRWLSLGAFIVAGAGSIAPAAAQSRLSLAERVERLESEAAASGQGTNQLETLNRIEQLQSEVQSLRNLIEQQRFEIERLKQLDSDRARDFDARLARLEGGGAAPTPGARIAPVDASGALASSGPGGLTAEPIIDNRVPPADVPLDEMPPGAVVPGATGAVGAAIGTPLPPLEPAAAVDEKTAYDQAFGALRDGRYAESARLFRAFVDAYPNSELAGNAMYWLGESYYVTENFTLALDTFTELMTRFPDSPKVSDAMLKLGYCHYELEQWTEAERTLNEVIARFPDTTPARLAQGRLRALRLDSARR